MDIIGKKFGRLTVQRESERRGYVVCACTCGNVLEVRKNCLTMKKGPTRSCGCIQREIARSIGANDIAANSAKQIAKNMKYNTNLQVISTKQPPKNNKSGHKGVWYDAKRGQYEAYITVHSLRVHLGRYSKIEDAIKARESAEEVFFAPLLELAATDA